MGDEFHKYNVWAAEAEENFILQHTSDVGFFVGLFEGNGVGRFVGLLLGSFEGTGVGLFVGCALGGLVGLLEGAEVGCES